MAAVDAIRLNWLNGINESSGARIWGTDKFFAQKNITVNSYAPGSINVFLSNAANGVNYFAHEADRFAAAAFESLLTPAKSEKLPRSYGWRLIQSYYAAFFAAHALFRVGGWACARLNSGHLNKINNEIKTLFGGSSLAGGIYLIKGYSGGSSISIQHLGGQGGGSHEALWSVFPSYLAHIRNLVIAQNAISTQDIKPIERLDDFLRLKGGGEWFSSVRNRLNYSHAYGAWHPYIKSTTPHEQVNLAINSWLENIENIEYSRDSDEILQFAKACSGIVGLCRVAIEDLAWRSQPKSPFRGSSFQLLSEAKNLKL